MTFYLAGYQQRKIRIGKRQSFQEISQLDVCPIFAWPFRRDGS